jgi:hypothetical protein
VALTVQALVIPALVAGIQLATCSGVRGWLDAGDTGHAPGAGKPRHDKRDEGEETSLSKSALKIAHEKGLGRSAVAGPDYWEDEGKTLSEWRDEKVGEGD